MNILNTFIQLNEKYNPFNIFVKWITNRLRIK